MYMSMCHMATLSFRLDIQLYGSSHMWSWIVKVCGFYGGFGSEGGGGAAAVFWLALLLSLEGERRGLGQLLIRACVVWVLIEGYWLLLVVLGLFLAVVWLLMAFWLAQLLSLEGCVLVRGECWSKLLAMSYGGGLDSDLGVLDDVVCVGAVSGCGVVASDFLVGSVVIYRGLCVGERRVLEPAVGIGLCGLAVRGVLRVAEA
ncbi:hypothetical protein ACOSQ3_023433 [Xanthoceras sorbifolium]